MAFDEGVAQRLRECFDDIAGEIGGVSERKMFGGICFMSRGHMVCGVVRDTLMARVGPDQYAAALKAPFAREMDFTGKPLKGFIYVAPEGFEDDAALNGWVKRCLDFVGTLPDKA
jgi:TfoX/Sxy family transcriptional regulator of competence genes